MEQVRLPGLLDVTDNLLPCGGRDQPCIIEVLSRHRSGDAALVAEDVNGSTETMRARLAFSKLEAAEALGCSVDFLEEHVLPELRVVRRGRRVFVAVAELERWLERSAALTLEGMP